MGTENHCKPELAKFRVEYVPNKGYFVADPDGKRVTGYASREATDHACEIKQRMADTARKRINRPCLRCGTVFASEGIHNRMCNRCRCATSNDDATPFSFGAIHGRKRA